MDQTVKNPPTNAGDLGLTPESGRSPAEGNTTHSSILVWENPWTEEPGRLYTVHGVAESDTTERPLAEDRKRTGGKFFKEFRLKKWSRGGGQVAEGRDGSVVKRIYFQGERNNASSYATGPI